MARLKVVAAEQAQSEQGDIVVLVESQEELAYLDGLDPSRVAWVEVPLELAERSELDPYSVDVVLRQPESEAGLLYELARAREPFRPRITIETLPGFEVAATVALSLHFPVRLLCRQPETAQIAELSNVLQRYLHDPMASQPVEPFHTALAALLQGHQATLWDALDENPAWIATGSAPDSVEEHLASLIDFGRECGACSLQSWCAGWLKWPDPDYDCEPVKNPFLGLEATADQLRSDVEQSMEVLS